MEARIVSVLVGGTARECQGRVDDLVDAGHSTKVLAFKS